MYLGDYAEDATLYFTWGSNDSNGASITRATNGEVRVYKNGAVAQSRILKGGSQMSDKTVLSLGIAPDTKVKCDNCGVEGPVSALIPIRDLGQRVDPGGIVPAGECPFCGSVADLEGEDNAVVDDEGEHAGGGVRA